jgi:DNA-binding MarR family transcriptional regulator
MVREPNELPERWQPGATPVGTANFARLMYEPAMAANAIVGRELAANGFGDLRPGLLTIGIHIETEGSRITDLAERAQVSKPTAVQAVDELVRLGYAERRPDPDDGRAKLVTMTERGVAAERLGRETVARVRDEWARAFGEKDMERLEALLRRLRTTLWPDAA